MAIAAIQRVTCAVSDRGRVVCWGASTRLSTCEAPECVARAPYRVDGVAGAVAIAVGHVHQCALVEDGSVLCWGDNYDGAVGPFERTVQLPQSVALPGAAVAIGAGTAFSCAIVIGGATYCWGTTPTFYQRGGGDLDVFSTPQRVMHLSAAAEVHGGFEHACTRTTVGGAECWGLARWSKLGEGDPIEPTDPLSPIAVAEIMDAARLASVPNRNCVIRASGALLCWGRNVERLPADGIDVDELAPVPVAAGEAFADVSLGFDHSCAVTLDGAVVCWGDNGRGQLGRADADPHLDRVPVSLPDDAIDVASGASHSCAMLASGDVYCWGENADGQLGAEGVDFSATPVKVMLPP